MPRGNSYTAEETTALVECMFDVNVLTFNLGCFYLRKNPYYQAFCTVADLMHEKLPLANGGEKRTVRALYSYLEKLKKEHKWTDDESGFAMAEDMLDIHYHLPKSQLPPLQQDTKDPINVAAMSSVEQEYLLSQLLHFGGSRILDAIAEKATNKMLMRCLRTIGSEVCRRCNLAPSFLADCLTCAMRCQEEHLPNLLDTIANVMREDTFKLDVMLFWFTHYNFKFFTLEYTTLQSYADDPGYYKQFWETVLNIGGYSVIEFLRGSMHSGQIEMGLTESGKFDPATAVFAFPGIPHVNTLARQKAQESLSIGIDEKNTRAAILACPPFHKGVITCDDTDINPTFTTYYGQEFGDEDLGDGTLQARQTEHANRIQQLQILRHALPVERISKLRAFTQSIIRPLSYYHELVSTTAKKYDEQQKHILELQTNANGATISHLHYKKLGEAATLQKRYERMQELTTSLYVYHTCEVAHIPNDNQTISDWVALLKEYIEVDYALHRKKATKLRAFIFSDTSRKSSTPFAKFPVSSSLGETKTREQITKILKQIHEWKGKVGAFIVDGDFGYLTRRDFDGSPLTRNELLRQLKAHWSTIKEPECLATIDPNLLVVCPLNHMRKAGLVTVAQQHNYPYPITSNTRVDDLKKWLKEMKISSARIPIKHASLDTMRQYAAQSQVLLISIVLSLTLLLDT